MYAKVFMSVLYNLTVWRRFLVQLFFPKFKFQFSQIHTQTGMVDRPNVQLIKWPGNSPGLNPIENAWSWMKMRLNESSATNIEEWKQDITRLWVTKMSENDYLQSLVTSMPRRMQEVLEKEGSMTHY